jgi:hypothetical protein
MIPAPRARRRSLVRFWDHLLLFWETALAPAWDAVGNLFAAAPPPPALRKRRPVMLAVEGLEGRWLPSSVQFTLADYRFDRDAHAAVIMVNTDRPADHPISVAYSTRDGTAHAGLDYRAVHGTLMFAPYTVSASFRVPLRPDPMPFFLEPGRSGTRTVEIDLSNPTNAALGNATATLTIVDSPGFTHRHRAATVTLTAVPDPSVFSQPVVLTAHVAPAHGSSSPSGLVTFRDNGQAIGVGVVDAAGDATVTVALLPPGDNFLRAVYQGDDAFGRARSARLDQVIEADPASTTSLSASPNPSNLG